MISFQLQELRISLNPFTPQQEDLTTIDTVTLAILDEDLEDDFVPLPPTPVVLSLAPSTPAAPQSDFQEIVSEIQVSEELIGSCITPCKMSVVKTILQSTIE